MEEFKNIRKEEYPVEMFLNSRYKIIADIQGRSTRDGNPVVFFYFTFLGDGWQKGVVTIFLFPTLPEMKIPVSANIDNLKFACKWVVDNNSHLEFLNEKPLVRQEGEDLEHGRATAIFRFDIE